MDDVDAQQVLRLAADRIPRQRLVEILEMLSNGQSAGEIATELKRSPYTVKTHVSEIYRRLGARNAAQAVRRGYEEGWLRTGKRDIDPQLIIGLLNDLNAAVRQAVLNKLDPT